MYIWKESCSKCGQQIATKSSISLSIKVSSYFSLSFLICHFLYIKIQTWLWGLGEKNKRNHIEVERWIINFFCLIPPITGTMLDLFNIENGKLFCLKKVKCFLDFPQGKYISCLSNSCSKWVECLFMFLCAYKKSLTRLHSERIKPFFIGLHKTGTSVSFKEWGLSFWG